MEDVLLAIVLFLNIWNVEVILYQITIFFLTLWRPGGFSEIIKSSAVTKLSPDHLNENIGAICWPNVRTLTFWYIRHVKNLFVTVILFNHHSVLLLSEGEYFHKLSPCAQRG